MRRKVITRILRIDDDPDGALRAAAAALRGGGVVAIPTDTVYGLAAVATKPEAVARLAAMKGRSKSQPIAVLVSDAAQAEELAGVLSAEAVSLMDAFWPGPLTIVLPAAEGTSAAGTAAECTANAAEVLSGPETAGTAAAGTAAAGTAAAGTTAAGTTAADTTAAGTTAADTTAAGTTAADTTAADTTIGIRCPDHNWVRQLARQVGPIAATSANLHGKPPCATAEEVAQAFSKTHETALESAISKSPEGSVPKTKPALIKPALIIDGGPSSAAASTVVDCLSPHPKILREGPITQEQIDAALSI